MQRDTYGPDGGGREERDRETQVGETRPTMRMSGDPLIIHLYKQIETSLRSSINVFCKPQRLKHNIRRVLQASS
jgi:hypothetical protein